MSLTFQELIDRAVQAATRGVDANTVDSDIEDTAEVLAPQIFHKVAREAAADPRKRSLLKLTKSITLANGTVDLSDDVMTEYMSDARLFDPAALTKYYSWVQEYSDFFGYLDNRLGYFTVERGVALRVIEPGATDPFSPGTGPSGARSLNIPCVPVIPTLATDPVVVPAEIADDFVAALAEALRGGPVEAEP